MSARYPVKWYTQEMQGAPQMSGGIYSGAQAPGKLAALLKEVLVTGFGLLAVESLVYDSSTGEVTATISSGHSYLKDSVLVMEGANEAAYNGEQRVTFVNATQFRYVPASIPSATTATGILSAKVAPVGWEVIAEDAAGEVIIFGSTDVDAGNTKLLVRNDANHADWDTNNTKPFYYAQVVLVEDVVDVTNYTEVVGGVWPASHFLGEDKWQLVADSRLMYLSVSYSYDKKTSTFMFGDISSVRPGDKYAVAVNFSYKNINWRVTGPGSSLLNHDLENERFLSRKYHQLLGTTKWKTLGLFPRMGTGLNIPNPADNGFYIGVDKTPVLESDGTLRGYLPGIINPYSDHAGLADINHHGMQSFPDKIIRFTKSAYNETTGPTLASTKQGDGLIGFDLTGPWR